MTFTDIDLAGDYEPARGPTIGNIRIVKEIYPPRMKLSFRLTDANGEVLKQGDRELSDLNFMRTAIPAFSNDPYRYEKTMLENWLDREFRAEKKN